MQHDHRETWRTLLGDLVKQPGERQRLTKTLGVNPLTITRWVTGQSVPRPPYLRQVLTLLSQHYVLPLTELIEDVPEFSLVAETPDKVVATIASPFYVEVLQMLATVPIEQSRWLIRKRILTHALEQLDPQQKNVTITLMRCVPPSSGHKVRSVQVIMGVGRSPWGGDLDQQVVFYGVDSVAGRVVSSGRMLTIQSFREETRLLSASDKEEISSLCTSPLQQSGRIAGTLNVLSSQPGFFLPSRVSLLQEYSNLLALTFPAEDFYVLSDIELCLIPPVPLQIPFLMSFRKHVLQAMKQTVGSQHAVTYAQADLLTWQHIEEELIQLALSTTT